MIHQTNETHDSGLSSWVSAANEASSDFPIQNLPFGVFRRRGTSELRRPGVAIGDQILDLAGAVSADLIAGPTTEATDPVLLASAAQACETSSLNRLMSLGPAVTSALRRRLVALLGAGSTDQEALTKLLVPMDDAEMFVPAEIGDYTDFYASIHHATNVGSMFRPDNPLLPNYKYVPIGYHGRASSIVISGTPVRRPRGQTRDESAPSPEFGPTRRLDYEMEVGFYVGAGNALGEPVPVDEATEHIFGFCLVNDWSARDIQAWEYQPLGPFLAKNFATSVSPWVVTAEALAPFRTSAFVRADDDPAPLPYLDSESESRAGGIDLVVEVWLRSAVMRDHKLDEVRLSRGNFKEMYWTVGQMLAHHTSNGCNLQSGDLIASGTVSGTSKESRGSMLELAWRGTEPVALPSGETRRFVEDGDEIILRGFCEREGFRRIGFGECSGIVMPSGM